MKNPDSQSLARLFLTILFKAIYFTLIYFTYYDRRHACPPYMQPTAAIHILSMSSYEMSLCLGSAVTRGDLCPPTGGAMHLEHDPAAAGGLLGGHQQQLSPALASDPLRGFSLPEDAASLLGALLQPDGWQQQQQQQQEVARRVSDAASLSPLTTPRTSLELGLRAKRPLSASPFPLEGGEGPIRGSATSLQTDPAATGGNYGHALRPAAGASGQLPPFQSLRPAETAASAASHGWTASPSQNYLVLPQSQAQLMPSVLKQEPLGRQEQLMTRYDLTDGPQQHHQHQHQQQQQALEEVSSPLRPPHQTSYLYGDGGPCDTPSGPLGGYPYKQEEPDRCQRYSAEPTTPGSVGGVGGYPLQPAAEPPLPSPPAEVTSTSGHPTPVTPAAPTPLPCLWAGCSLQYDMQTALVKHIEKVHVDSRGCDEYTCYWADCPRQQKPFNARYKLMIHMRVHSGEKPNLCTVRVVVVAFYLCLHEEA